MKKICLILCLFVLSDFVFARSYDLFFHDDGDKGLCVSKNPRGNTRRDRYDIFQCRTSFTNDIRIRVVNPKENKNQRYGFDIVRPIFIIDGIYLGTDTLRTLESFYEETMQFGLTDMLVEFGYTPILVQFSETVRKSLVENSFHFANLLHFVCGNRYFGFPNMQQDGIIVLGVSQGGIIGRYGAYRYDIERNFLEAPIRIYGSLDSPHQGAVMPKGLFHTIDFWSKKGGSADAEAFADLIKGPGASELLLTNEITKESGDTTYEDDLSDSRFLFSEYRKAAEHRNYPSILIAQGQLKGISDVHPSKYYELDRIAKKGGVVLGRAQSEMSTAEQIDSKQIAFNRVYKFNDKDAKKKVSSQNAFDFVQGSTYPFSQKIYESLRSGFKDAMPENMKQSLPFGSSTKISINTSWEDDTLFQKNSTFIPTVSAMDLYCNNDFSIRRNCAFTEKYTDVSFENPGARSSATAMFAVDPTHPRFHEPTNGRHIELPVHSSGEVDTNVLLGMQVDIWRFMCEVAKYDYDFEKSAFRNENLTGVFNPYGSCMDLSNMPEAIRNAGLVKTRKFAYARYDYNTSATEMNEAVSFDVPAGWHKVALIDNGSNVSFNGNFVVDISAYSSKSSWMKAELLLLKSKSGSGQLQLQEVDVPVDGNMHTLKWPIDFAEDVSTHYRWFRLVLNSDGGHVTILNPRFERQAYDREQPETLIDKFIYPNANVLARPWQESTVLSPYADELGTGLRADFNAIGSAFYLDFNEKKNLEKYARMKVSYWPGTCQGTSLYFDSYKKGQYSLKGGTADGLFVSKEIPLSSVIDTTITPQNKFSASRLVFQSTLSTEVCIINQVFF